MRSPLATHLGKGDKREMIYEFIFTQKTDFKISLLAKVCNVPLSSYYDWLKRRESIIKKHEADNLLKEQILEFYKKSRSNCGVPKMTEALKDNGVHLSRKKVAKLMVELVLKGTYGRKKMRTIIRDKSAILSPDLVNRNFTAKAPDELMVSDLTYISKKEGWLYLVVILDVCTRRILGTRKRTTFSGTAFHSDHGSQYTSGEFRAVLKASIKLHLTV